MSSLVDLQIMAALSIGCYDTVEIIQRRQVAGVSPLSDSEFRERTGAELTGRAMRLESEEAFQKCREASLLRKEGSNANRDDQYC